jgi:hypothetical protein
MSAVFQNFPGSNQNGQLAVDPQVTALRIPPHSIEAEQSVIGGQHGV